MNGFALASSSIAFLLGSILQSAVGFGAGLVAVPLLVWVGVALPKAVGMMLGVITVHAGYNCYLGRTDIRWAPLLPMTALRWSSMPVGVWIMERFLLQSRAQAKQAVGAVLLASLAMTLKSSKTPRSALHPVWMWAAGISSGVLAGAVGMGGPPLSLYALNHNWSSERIKAYMWALFLLGAPMTVAIMFTRFGVSAIEHWLIGMAHAPVIWLGSHIGLKLTALSSRESLRRISFAALFAIALLSIAAPWLAS